MQLEQGILNRTLIAFASIFAVAFVILFFSISLQGSLDNILLHPIEWFRNLDSSIAFDIASTSAELLAAILAITITVVAIVVELAANRYTHRITSLFVREPINIIVMSFFVVATLQSIWISLTFEEVSTTALIPNAGLLISMLAVSISLVILLPYFAFVLSFLSPVSVISKIEDTALKSITKKTSIESRKIAIRNGIDELQDIARRASELSDRAVAMASINSLCNLLIKYQTSYKKNLPKEWFLLDEISLKDPDFVSLNEKVSIPEIEANKSWVEVKIMRQYLDLITDSNPSSRDTTYLVAINTRKIGAMSIDYDPVSIELYIHCFNSYLRTTVNNRDARTGYFIMNQYRLMAESLLRSGNYEAVQNIAFYLQFYGLLGYKSQLPFLLEVAAYDVAHLIEECITIDKIGHGELIDILLGLLLELDQEIKEESESESLLGIRRAQLQLATRFVEAKDNVRLVRICDDLNQEKSSRLTLLIEELKLENRADYWEFTDRGINFGYLEPKLRFHLDAIESRLISN